MSDPLKTVVYCSPSPALRGVIRNMIVNKNHNLGADFENNVILFAIKMIYI